MPFYGSKSVKNKTVTSEQLLSYLFFLLKALTDLTNGRKESVLKPVKFKELSTDLDYDVTDNQKGFYRDLVQIKKELKYNPKTEKYEASAEDIKKLRKDMIRLSEKYGAQLNLYLFLEGEVPEGASLSDYIDFTSLPKNVYVVVWGENGKLNSNGFQAE